MATGPTNEELLNLIRQQQASEQPSSSVFQSGGYYYQPLTSEPGSPIIRYKPGETQTGKSYEFVDPQTGQPTGQTGQFQDVKGFGQTVQQFAQDVAPIAGAALGMGGLGGVLGEAAASALGIPTVAGGAAGGLTAAQVAGLGTGLGQAGLGLAQGQNPLEAIKAGLLTGATQFVPTQVADLLPATGNAAIDAALKSAVASGTRAALTGQNVEQAILGGLASSGLGTATGIDPRIIGSGIKIAMSGGDPQQIFNSAVEGLKALPKVTDTGDETARLQNRYSTPPQDPFAQRTEELQQLASGTQPFETAAPASQNLGQSLIDLAQGSGDQLAFAGALPAAAGLVAETAAAQAARTAITRALQSSAEVAIPAIQQAAAASPAVAQALASPAVQRLLAGMASAGIATGPLLGFVAQPTDTGDETARLATRYPATTTPAAATATTEATQLQPITITGQRQPNLDPLSQLASTSPNITGDPYVYSGDAVPSTVDAQRLAEVLKTDVATANALLAANPQLYGELIGGATTGSTPADVETMSSTDIRALEGAARAAAEETGATTSQTTTTPQTAEATVVSVDPVTNKALVMTNAGSVYSVDVPVGTVFQPNQAVQVNTATKQVVSPTETQTAPTTTPTVTPTTTPTVTPTTTPTTSSVPATAPTTQTVPTTQPVSSTVPVTSTGTVTVPETVTEPSVVPTTPVVPPGVTTTTVPPVEPVFPPPVLTPPPAPPPSEPPGALPPEPPGAPPPEPPGAPPPEPPPVVPQEDVVTTPESPEPTPGVPPSEPPPAPPPEPPAPPKTQPSGPTYLFSPLSRVLTEALFSFRPPGFGRGQVGLSGIRPAGEIESEVSGKRRRDVWNEASLRLKDALGL